MEWDEQQEQEALEIISKQKQAKVGEDKKGALQCLLRKDSQLIIQKEKFDKEAANFWNDFYSRNTNKFFKDRHWLRIEFPELFENLPKDSTVDAIRM